ncbi:helix-turn-helix transcriptional regulator [Paenibacillus kobensis]|uniref:helix-turn-helix transcriptional regulator n=1 Tax=Paenibacillus kobensis TaxID=59841 RepID=UPI000FDB58C4|nr:WYL domain-containing protein [Paenibacillus kobensis]
MSNTHRIQWFDQQIRESRYPNSGHLAEQFEISRRQAQRDIEYMAESLRAPLMYDAKRRGYKYEDNTYMLPLLYMTDDEKQVLKYLVHRYRQYNYDHADAAHRVALLLDRFTDEAESELYGRLPVFYADPKRMQTVLMLTEAIKQSRAVDIVYEGRCLSIQPLRLRSRYNEDYVEAYSEQDGEQRQFRLSAIEQAALTNRSFTDQPLPTPSAAQGEAPIRKPFVAKVRLHHPLNGSSWNGFTAVAGRDEDGLQYEIEFYDTDAFLRQLMASEWAELQSPKWLKEKLKRAASELLARLNTEA